MKKSFAISRRNFLQLSVGSLAAASVGIASGQRASVTASGKKQLVRDRFWAWAHEAGVYNGHWGLSGTSRITPVEGAHYLGVPNIIFIRYENKPAMPCDQYAVPFRSLQRVIWSITGAGGLTSDQEREQVLQLAAKMPNFTGVFMDDFFNLSQSPQDFDGAKAASSGALTVPQLRQLREKLNINGRKLDLGVTLYMTQLDARILGHIDLCDVVSLWTWKATDLHELEANFEKAKKLLPGKRLLLGCYMWDFGTEKPMPLDLMKKQCELGLQWLKAGRIEGMIFLATNICDLQLESVEWTREWIAQVGNQRL